MSMSTKKLFILCLVFSLLLVTASCGNSTSSDSAAALEFMNIPWNSTPAQVIEAMNFSEADIEQTETPENGLYAITAHDVEIFGTTALTVIFQFDDYTRQGEHYGLDSILIYFPDESETETAKIANELTAMYADAFEGLESYTHFLDSTGGQWVHQ